MTLEQTVDIPASHRLTIDVPPGVPMGRAILTFTLKPAELESDGDDDGLNYEGECPLCAIYKEPNAETIAAMEEGDAMERGEIPAKRFHSLEELLADLRS